MADEPIAIELIKGILKVIWKSGKTETIRQGLQDYGARIDGAQIFIKHNKTHHTMSYDIKKRLWNKH
jgi:hypothetical protein